MILVVSPPDRESDISVGGPREPCWICPFQMSQWRQQLCHVTDHVLQKESSVSEHRLTNSVSLL